MNLELLSVPCPLKKEGEDAYIRNDRSQIYGVLDGVTPLDDFRDADGHNGAYLASHLFKHYFEAAESVSSLPEALLAANAELRRKMSEQRIDQSVRHHLWSTCAAIVRITGKQAEYVQVGDCMIVAGYGDGTVRVLTEDWVKGISERAKARRERDRLQGVQIPDESYFEITRNRLANNRWMANQPDGYGVANGMPEMAGFMQSGAVELRNLSALLLVTDGLFDPEHDLEWTFKQILEQGLETYVRILEEKERTMDLRPDDKTALLLRFQTLPSC